MKPHRNQTEVIIRDEAKKTDSAGIAKDKYLVPYNKNNYTVYLILLFVVLAFCTIVLIRNGLSDPVTGIAFILCAWGIFTLLCLVGYLSGKYKKEYFLMADEKGITINKRKPLFIPWEDIAGFEVYSFCRHVYLGIDIYNEEKYTTNKSAFNRLMVKQKKFFGDSLFQIDFNAADESIYKVLPELEIRWQKSRKDVSLLQKSYSPGVRTNNESKNLFFDENTSIRAVAKAKVFVIGLIGVNVFAFAINLYVSNHCWTVVDFKTLLVLFRDHNIDTLWMSEGMTSFEDLIWYGPILNLGEVFFGLNTESILYGHSIHQMFTYAFLHADIMHLLSNMVALYFISSMVFVNFGKKGFTVLYVSGIYGGALATLEMAAITGQSICAVGASSAIFGLIGGSFSPMVYKFYRLKSARGEIGATNRRTIFNYIVFILIMIVPGFFEENVSWEGHLGGLIGGLIAGVIIFKPKESE